MRKLYEDNIEDVALEISIASEWRKKILNLKKGEYLDISFHDGNNLPNYIRDVIVKNKLIFCVQKVEECPEAFDENLIIFKFWAKKYADIYRYSGNNPNII